VKGIKLKVYNSASYFNHIVTWVIKKGAIISAVFLLGVMLLVVANIVARLFGSVVKGSIELIELMIVVTVALALGFTALKQSHVIVNIIFSRFSNKVQATIRIFTITMSIGVCAVITWASARIMYERALLNEQTDLLKISSFPFRLIWVFGLVLFCLILLIDLGKAISEALKK
jgi:TRAP-type C4-dicarboxylate transport system permease small subunit